MKNPVMLSLVLLLSACATSGTTKYIEPTPSQDQATIVIFREKGIMGSFDDHNYYVNGERVAALGTHTYTSIQVNPGRTTVRWSQRVDPKPPYYQSEPIEFDTVGGTTYYYKEGITTTMFIPMIATKMKLTFGLVEPEAAKQELVTYTYVKPLSGKF